jgi:hypothetical protein
MATDVSQPVGVLAAGGVHQTIQQKAKETNASASAVVVAGCFQNEKCWQRQPRPGYKPIEWK